MSKGAEYWAGHLAAINAEGITTKAYAEREGLSAAALYWWRRRLEGGRQAGGGQRVRGGVFVAVQVRESGEAVRCRLVLAAGTTLELAQLPSPQWIAALSAAVAGQGR